MEPPAEPPAEPPTEPPVETPEEIPEEAPEETPGEIPEEGLDEALGIMPISMLRMVSPPGQTDYAEKADSPLYVHDEMVSQWDTITYQVTVKYVGDVGVRSGRITLNFPIPEDIAQFQGGQVSEGGEFLDPGWHATTTAIRESHPGSSGDNVGGRVVEQPEVKQLSDGSFALQGVFEGLYTGTEVTVSIITTVQAKDEEDYNEAGYAFWDGTAYATDSAGTAVSRTVRLWNLKEDESGTTPTPPETKFYQLSYQFTGDVPSDAELPESVVLESGANVTAASEPTTALEGYTFDGWYRSDDGQPVTAGAQITMPESDLTLTGKWTLDDDKVQKITIRYQYTDNNDGQHIPDGAPEITQEQEIKVGYTHYIQKIDTDASYHTFGGWVPTLSIGGQDIPLTKQADGTYQSEDGAYVIDLPNGALSTDQFRGKTDVIVTFGGAWTPYKGTIQFDANGGTGTTAAMYNVTWDTKQTLTPNGFTYPISGYTFEGWTEESGSNEILANGASAAGLIDEDGKVVTLYAVWKRSTYGVAYDLSHVSSSEDTETVSLGGTYTTTLTVEDGYEMSEISITMGGVAITNQVYNAETGEVTIPNVSGNIYIQAKAAIFHTVTVSVTNGTARPSGTVKVEHGKNQTITFTPNSGYELESVTVDGAGASLTGNSYTFADVTADHSISVKYKKTGNDGGNYPGGSVTDKYPVHVDSTGSGTAQSDKDQAAAGEKVTITTDGTVEDIKVTDKNGNEIPVTDNGDGSYTFEMPKSEVTVTVEFDQQPGVEDPDDTGVSDWLNTKDHLAFMVGYDTGLFGADRDMTRAEAAQMFYNLLLNKDVPITVTFTDVPEDAWYATAVNTLASLGVIEGVGGGQFAPHQAITRAELTALAMRFGNEAAPGENIFSDITPDDWFYAPVLTGVQYGWITGYTDGTFRPNNTITRAEAATLTNKMLGRLTDQSYADQHRAELRLFPDVADTHWAFYQIVEATNSHDYTKASGNEIWQSLN